MKLKHLAMLFLALLLSAAACAQMEFTFSGGATAKTSTLADGTVMVELPPTADLQGCITGVAVDGTTVDASAVVPNPTTTLITEGEIETFVYQNKAYSFRFYTGGYFTVVMFSDAHTAPGSNYANDELARFVTDITKMGQSDGKKFSFSKAPKGYVPTSDLVLFLGDMEADKPTEKWKNFYNSTKSFNNAGIPFVAIAGNHELSPDYYNDDTSKGETGDEGRTCSSVSQTTGVDYDQAALEIVSDILNDAKNTNKIEEVKIYQDESRQSSGTTKWVQAKPFSFKFHGVRFYMGQTYWFQKMYTYSSLTASGHATCYAPDAVIAELDNDVTTKNPTEPTEPSIWAQHYPFVYGSDCNRWWLDQNNEGRYIVPSGTNAYLPSGIAKNDATQANARKDVLKTIIDKTKNPVHFSGHVHSYAKQNYKGLDDYSLGNGKGKAYIVLCKEGTGFVEFQEVTFNY